MLNLWTGYDAERLPLSNADVEPILKHLRTLLKTEENYNHNLDWFANMIQCPSSQSIMMIWRSEKAVVCGKHQNVCAEANFRFCKENQISFDSVYRLLTRRIPALRALLRMNY
jgi:hypothetical protein